MPSLRISIPPDDMVPKRFTIWNLAPNKTGSGCVGIKAWVVLVRVYYWGKE